MYKKLIRNVYLAIVAALLLLNLGVMLSPAVHAIPATQYKALEITSLNGSMGNTVQQALDQQSAQGWQYVGSVNGILIFKK